MTPRQQKIADRKAQEARMATAKTEDLAIVQTREITLNGTTSASGELYEWSVKIRVDSV